MNPYYWLGYHFSRLLARLFFDFRIVHRERMIQTGPVILAMNHQSFFDPPLAGNACDRAFYFLAKKSLMKAPVLGWLLPKLKGRIKAGRSKVGPQEIREMWQVMGSCERLNVEAKADLGEELVRLVEKDKASDLEIWALARLGARALLYGPANCVVRRETAAHSLQSSQARLPGVCRTNQDLRPRSVVPPTGPWNERLQ